MLLVPLYHESNSNDLMSSSRMASTTRQVQRQSFWLSPHPRPSEIIFWQIWFADGAASTRFGALKRAAIVQIDKWYTVLMGSSLLVIDSQKIFGGRGNSKCYLSVFCFLQ
jgi:hypothetical protein